MVRHLLADGQKLKFYDKICELNFLKVHTWSSC